MITLLGMSVIAVWFYTAARSAHRSPLLWSVLGVALYFVLGFTLLIIYEKIITPDTTFADVSSMSWEKTLFQLISMILILFSGFIIQNTFLKKADQL